MSAVWPDVYSRSYSDHRVGGSIPSSPLRDLRCTVCFCFFIFTPNLALTFLCLVESEWESVSFPPVCSGGAKVSLIPGSGLVTVGWLTVFGGPMRVQERWYFGLVLVYFVFSWGFCCTGCIAFVFNLGQSNCEVSPQQGHKNRYSFPWKPNCVHG